MAEEINEVEQGHTVKSFDDDMREVHGMVLRMGDLVLDQIDRALEALKAEDPEEARSVIQRDQDINELDVKVDDAIIHLVARRQPMARDLRAVMTVAKSVTDLERMGDQIRKVALLVVHLYDNNSPLPNSHMLGDIPDMAACAANMLRNALKAYDTLDTDLALEVIRRDLELEADFEDSLRRLATFIMQDSRTIGHAVDVVLGLRAVERIGGHAKNIAGHVIFLATGKDVRHVDATSLARDLGKE